MNTSKKNALVQTSLYSKMEIPEKVEKKIRYLCNKMPHTEWSGILFYSTKGSMKDKNLVIVCEDILLMNIGTSTLTEFEMSPEVVSYMCENELLDCNIALIHNHHNMSTNFSGTDMNTLHKEGKTQAHFVSLIVNNAGTYTAKITRKCTTHAEGKVHKEYKTFNDEVVKDNYKEVKDVTIVEYDDLEIIKTNEKNDYLDKRIDSLKYQKQQIIEETLFSDHDFGYEKFDRKESEEDDIAAKLILCDKDAIYDDLYSIVDEEEHEQMMKTRFVNFFEYADCVRVLVTMLVDSKEYAEEILHEIHMWGIYNKYIEKLIQTIQDKWKLNPQKYL